MNKRILAVGNGNELLESTPQGDVIRWTWDARQKRYSPITEDRASSYGVQLDNRAVMIEPLKPVVPNGNGVISLPSDDHKGAGW